MALGGGVPPPYPVPPSTRGPFASHVPRGCWVSLGGQQWATPSLGHGRPPRRCPFRVAPPVPPQLGVMVDPLGPPHSPGQLSAVPGSRDSPRGWMGRVLLWHPKIPQMRAGSRQGTAWCPRGPRKGLIYCCLLKDAIKGAAGAGSAADGADQRLINVGQLVILSDNYPQTV